MRDGPSLRAKRLRNCLLRLYEFWGAEQYVPNLAIPNRNQAANEEIRYQVDIAICTTSNRHCLGDLGLAEDAYEHVSVNCDPLMLGFECHALLRDRLGDYDFYCYLEDDLLLVDPWHFVKLIAFTRQAGVHALLQPNRYEIKTGFPPQKVYVDGDLAPQATARYQEISARPQILVSFLDRPLLCRRTRNPHAACFFLSAEQMDYWSKQPYFLDRDASFFSPLESAATLGIMRTFYTYKPARQVASYFEVEHQGSGQIERIQQRDAASAGGRVPMD